MDKLLARIMWFVATGMKLVYRIIKKRRRVVGSLPPLASGVLYAGIMVYAEANPTYIDDDTRSGGDGSNGATAFMYLQDALARAS